MNPESVYQFALLLASEIKTKPIFPAPKINLPIVALPNPLNCSSRSSKNLEQLGPERQNWFRIIKSLAIIMAEGFVEVEMDERDIEYVRKSLRRNVDTTQGHYSGDTDDSHGQTYIVHTPTYRVRGPPKKDCICCDGMKGKPDGCVCCLGIILAVILSFCVAVPIIVGTTAYKYLPKEIASFWKQNSTLLRHL